MQETAEQTQTTAKVAATTIRVLMAEMQMEAMVVTPMAVTFANRQNVLVKRSK